MPHPLPKAQGVGDRGGSLTGIPLLSKQGTPGFQASSLAPFGVHLRSFALSSSSLRPSGCSLSPGSLSKCWVLEDDGGLVGG